MVSHKPRPAFDKPAAVHVTIRMARRVWNLRSRRCYRMIEGCFEASLGRFGLRLIEFAVLGNHLHLVVEADSRQALSRGMQGLGVRVAKALNGVMGSSGRVLADHYHSRILRTPTELVNAIAYVLGNHAHHHGGPTAADPFSSAWCDRTRLIGEPRSWLLRVGWRRAGRKLPERISGILPPLETSERAGTLRAARLRSGEWPSNEPLLRSA
jgi:putative transposase